jgi:hypothetical protein
MIRRSMLLCAALGSAALAKDPNQPVKQGALELGVGYTYAYFPGIYDDAGEYQTWETQTVYPSVPDDARPALSAIPLRAKYGLGRGLDLKAEWDAAFYNEDGGSLKGMGQPKLGLRYLRPVGGLFSNVSLPYATGDFYHENLKTYLEVGGLLRHKIERFRMTAMASYTDNFEQYQLVRGSLKPEFVWDKKTSAYATLSYLQALHVESYWFLLTPGVRADVSTALAVEFTAPITIAGRNAPAAWTFQGILYWTLGR